MIQTIKQQHSGWLINGNMSVPDNAENRHYQEIQDAINGTGDYEGNPITVEPEFTPEQIFANTKAELTSAVQNHLDSKAREKGYDNIFTASLRAAIPNSPYYTEGVAYGEWMDLVWYYCYQVLADVEAGVRAIPTEEELITELPIYGV